MGIIVNGCAIFLGGILGNGLKRYVKWSNVSVLGIGIMLISCFGMLENMLTVTSRGLESQSLIIVVLALFIGSFIGEKLRLEKRVQRVGRGERGTALSAFLTGSVFFGIGGLQLSGAIALALNADSSQLFFKSIVDFPFALTFGAAYGLGISASCIPVMLMQLLIALLAYVARPLFSAEAVRQICAIGYIILFFTGFNLAGSGKYKVNTINMIPAILLIVGYQAAICIVEGIR